VKISQNFVRFRLLIFINLVLLSLLPRISFAEDIGEYGKYYKFSESYFSKIFRENTRADVRAAQSSGEKYEYDVYFCDSIYDYVTPRLFLIDRKLSDVEYKRAQLMVLAFNVGRLKGSLLELGYSKTIWEKKIEDIVKLKMNYIDNYDKSDMNIDEVFSSMDVDYHSFVKVLNADPLVKSGNAPRVIEEGGCGAGEFSVKLKAEGSKEVYLITDFEYKYCRVSGVDPEDIVKCQDWVTAATDIEYAVSGQYRYKIRAADRSKVVDLDRYVELWLLDANAPIEIPLR
jgi:hypothetical protein